MVKVDINIPDSLDMKIQRMVDEGEFVDYESAVSELISSGLTAYRTDKSSDDFRDNYKDDMNPSEPEDSHNDEYVF
jgi:Arc/MetJ-type ribon-helix-helix transcriptional regulator